MAIKQHKLALRPALPLPGLGQPKEERQEEHKEALQGGRPERPGLLFLKLLPRSRGAGGKG